MSQKNSTASPERDAEFRRLAWERENGKKMMYNLFGLPLSEDHQEFLSRQDQGQGSDKEQTTNALPSEEPNQKFSAAQRAPQSGGKGKGKASEARDVYAEISRRNKCPIKMHSQYNGWRGMIAVLDSGCEENWISREKVQLLNLHQKTGLNKCFETFNGQEFSSGTIVNPTWQPEGDERTYETEFRVVPNSGAPFDVLFGRNWLERGEVDFRAVKTGVGVLAAKNSKPDEKAETAQNATAHQSRREALNKVQSQKTQSSGKKSSESSSNKTKEENKKGGGKDEKRKTGSSGSNAGTKK